MITKQEILEDFWENFPQYQVQTFIYDDIRFEEEEIREWNKNWIDSIFKQLKNKFYEIETLKDLEEYIKLK